MTPRLDIILVPLDLIAVIRALVKAARKDSDGGRRVTLAEAEVIAARLADLAEHLRGAVAAARS